VPGVYVGTTVGSGDGVLALGSGLGKLDGIRDAGSIVGILQTNQEHEKKRRISESRRQRTVVD
jgi:hypothetical protein